LWLPKNASTLQDLPLVLLLHGVYGSHWSWFLQGGAHLTAQEMIVQGDLPPVAIACPSDGLYREGSGYLPLAQADFEGWIGEVPEVVRAVASCCSAVSPLFLAGLSMGGYGSLRLGMKYPHRYAAVSAHSAITAPEQFRQFFEPQDADELLAVATENWQLLHWADGHRKEIPPLRFDCGRDDALFSDNEVLHRTLHAMAVPHTFEALSGSHDWSYWRANIKRSFEFFAQVLVGGYGTVSVD
jgi:enterochelin esterase-like enzyme